jgi:hypothetical protein
LALLPGPKGSRIPYLFSQTNLGWFEGCLATLFRRQLVGSRPATFQTALAAKYNGGLSLGGVFGAPRCTVFNLASQNIADKSAWLYGIAGAERRLAVIVAVCRRSASDASEADFKLYRYRISSILGAKPTIRLRRNSLNIGS